MGAQTIQDGDQEAALAALRDHLAELQVPQIVHGRRAIVIFEGPEGAGKKQALKQLAASFDPCHYAVHCTRHDRREASEGHWLARFWRQLPGAGDTAIFFRSWYRRVLDDRILGHVEGKALARAFDEINEFEAQQRDYGTVLVKLYFHATDKVLDERITASAADPWRHHLLGPVELRTVDGREAYRHALAVMFKQTDTRWAPWVGIDANDEQAARIAALTVIADALEKAIPMEPPERAEEPVHFKSPRLSPA